MPSLTTGVIVRKNGRWCHDVAMCLDELKDQLSKLLATLNTASATDWIGAIAALITAVVAVVALVYARGQLKDAELTRKQARQLELERNQPSVVIFSEPSAATNLAIDIVIKNFGPTPARDIRVHLSPWPQRSRGAVDVAIPSPLAILAPGQEWRTSWEWGPDRNDSPLPDRHVGQLTYLGIGDVELTSPAVLDYGAYRKRHWVEVRGLHDAAKALRDIRDLLKKA